MKRVGGLVVGFWILSLLSCRPAANGRSGSAFMVVELDAFSGQPNPRWELTDDQTSEVLAMVRQLPSSQASQVTPDGLGYRGFVVRPGAGSVGGFDEIRVFRGTVVARRGERVETFSDPDRLLEHWLARSGRGNAPDSVLEFVESEIRD